jgi:hypothetical protein
MSDDDKFLEKDICDYLKKNKTNRKKQKYHDIRSYVSSNSKFRKLVKTELKKTDIEDYVLPVRDRHTTYTWWDCKPEKPKVY